MNANELQHLTVRVVKNGFVVEGYVEDGSPEWVFVSERALGQWMEAWAKEAFRLKEKA